MHGLWRWLRQPESRLRWRKLCASCPAAGTDWVRGRPALGAAGCFDEAGAAWLWGFNENSQVAKGDGASGEWLGPGPGAFWLGLVRWSVGAEGDGRTGCTALCAAGSQTAPRPLCLSGVWGLQRAGPGEERGGSGQRSRLIVWERGACRT